jgi:hypothetical protein
MQIFLLPDNAFQYAAKTIPARQRVDFPWALQQTVTGNRAATDRIRDCSALCVGNQVLHLDPKLEGNTPSKVFPYVQRLIQELPPDQPVDAVLLGGWQQCSRNIVSYGKRMLESYEASQKLSDGLKQLLESNSQVRLSRIRLNPAPVYGAKKQCPELAFVFEKPRQGGVPTLLLNVKSDINQPRDVTSWLSLNKLFQDVEIHPDHQFQIADLGKSRTKKT